MIIDVVYVYFFSYKNKKEMFVYFSGKSSFGVVVICWCNDVRRSGTEDILDYSRMVYVVSYRSVGGGRNFKNNLYVVCKERGNRK